MDLVACIYEGQTPVDDFLVVERCRLERIHVATQAFGQVMLRDVTIDGVKNWPCVASNLLLDRVTLRGSIDRWILRSDLEALPARLRPIAAGFHDGVEWALDLREARLGDVELRSVPVDKILCEPARHFIARLDRMREDRSWTKLRGLPATATEWLLEPVDRMLVVVNELVPETGRRQAALYAELVAKGFMEVPGAPAPRSQSTGDARSTSRKPAAGATSAAVKPPTMRRVEKRECGEVRLARGTRIQDTHFVDCKLVGSLADRELLTVERCLLERTQVVTRRLENLILREVTIDGMKSGGCFAYNVLFDRVTLRGKLDQWFVRPALESLNGDDLERALDFYDGVEWALDLRGAQLGEVELRGVPADKILRDPARHLVLRLDRMREDASWRTIEGVPASAQHWLNDPIDRMVVVLDELSRNAADQRVACARLVAKGFME